MAKVHLLISGTEYEYLCLDKNGEEIESFGSLDCYDYAFNIEAEVDDKPIKLQEDDILGDKIKYDSGYVKPTLENTISKDCVGIKLYKNECSYHCYFEADEFDASKLDIEIGYFNLLIPTENVYSLPQGCKIKGQGGYAYNLLGINYDGIKCSLEFDRSEGIEKGLVWGIEPGRKYTLKNFLSDWMNLKFVDGLAAACLVDRGCYCYVNENAEIVIPAIFELADLFCDMRASVILGGKGYGYIDRQGKIVIECKYQYAAEFSEGVASVEMNDKKAVIDKNGNLITPFEYDHIWPSRNGVMKVRKGKSGEDAKYGYINTKGEVVLPIEYESIPNDYEFDKLGVVQKGKLYGYINKSAQVVIPLIYDKGGDFSEGLASVKRKGCYGYINEDGEEVIPFIYGMAGRFKKGKAKVRLKGSKESFFIDKEGNKVD